MKKITTKISALIGALCMAVSMFAFPAFAADPGYTYDPVSGSTVHAEKYLVMDDEANVPNVAFVYSIRAGEAIPGEYNTDGTTVKLPVWAGNDASKVTGSPTVGTAVFRAGQETFDEVQENENDDLRNKDGSAVRLKDKVTLAEDGSQKYARSKIEVDFSGVQYKEPGIYRYVITENCTGVIRGEGSGASKDDSIVFDEDDDRIMDVYVIDNNGRLEIEGYVLHNTEENAIVLEDGSSQQPTKTDGFENIYLTEDLTLEKKVSGNQASRDEYFEFTVKISNAIPGTVYDVVDTSPDPNAQTFDRTTKINGINTEAHTNVTSLTVGSDGTVTATFWLQGDQSLKICGLAKGTSYSINENKETMDGESYEVTAAISGDTQYGDESGEGVAITLDDASVEGNPCYRMDDDYIQEDTTVTYTNKKAGIIPTGVTLAVLPGAAVALAGAAGIAVLAAKKRKKEED